MGKILGVVGGVGILIALYLILVRGDETVQIIDTLAENTIQGIAVLQGRSV